MNRITMLCSCRKLFVLSIAFLSYFNSSAQDPLIVGPGGPILVITSNSNPFSAYTAEILRTEGLNEFTSADISTVTGSVLNNYDVVILGEMSISASQTVMLTDWVNGGGILIAFRPDDQLAPLMGLAPVVGTLDDSYIKINTDSGPGAGIVGESIQYHGTADLYTLVGATGIAMLYSSPNVPTINPAVSVSEVGTHGGKAIAFTYDLPKSIVYTRQGNPAWVGQKRDGQTGPIRSDDLFFGNKAGDSQSDWIDFGKITIPQADEQQRLLANIIIQYNLHRKPLPRFWYLPRGIKAAIVMTGDDHANNGTTGRFNLYNHLSDSIGHNSTQDVKDWYAIRGTSYIYSNTPIEPSDIVTFQNQGFEIGVHPTTDCNNFTPSSLETTFATALSNFTFNYPGALAPVSNRTHCMVWSDWSTHAKVEKNHGIRYDVNYYYWPASWVQDQPGMFTGSGMPMRFADLDGTMIDCFQSVTQMTDESGIDVAEFCNEVLDRATGSEGYYGVFTANMHTDTANHHGSNAIVASALEHNVPIVSAKQMLTWLDGRNNSTFGTIGWNGSVLTFDITAASGSNNLRAMLPMNSGANLLTQITRNGSAISFDVSTIKGMQYAFFDASVTGSYTASYAGSLPVTLTDISAQPSGKKITVRWSTASEINNKGFDVMRSKDGITWTTIGFVTGAGNSDKANEYNFIDNNLESGRYYYKLKQIDIDDKYKYSVIVSATIGGKGEYALQQNYPNPFVSTTTIQYSLPKAGRVKLSLFDVSGREIKVLVNGSKDAGTHAVNLNKENFSKGMYYYKLQVDDFSDVKKLVIQ